MKNPVRKVAIAEAVFAGLIGILLIVEGAPAGLRGMFGGTVLAGALVVVTGLVLVLPALLLAAGREITKPEMRWTAVQFCVVILGANLWLALASLLALFFSSGSLFG